jgi:cell division protein FtsB
METMNKAHEPGQPESNSWKIAAAVFGVLFLAAVVFGGVFYSKYNQSTHRVANLGTELESTRTQLQGELSTLNTQYSDQIAVNDTLSSDLKAKVAEVEDLEVRIAKARKDLKTSQANNTAIKARLDQMEELKVALEKDIENLRAENSTLAQGNAELNSELITTKDQVNTLNQQVMSLTTANEKLTGRLKTVAPAGFRADNFTVTSETKNDKLTTKGKKIDEITVSFDLNNIPATGDSCWWSGERCLRVRPNQPDTPGRLGTQPFGHYDPRAGSLLYHRSPVVNRYASAARACGARLHGNHRGEAPQGAPARVKGRRSLPLKGQAPPQGGPRVRRLPHQRLVALHSPRSVSRRARTDDGWAPAIPAAMTLARWAV